MVSHGKQDAPQAQEAAAVWVSTDDLHPWDQNPRDNAKAIAEVAKSIRRFGWGAPIVANKRDGEIIAGHTRFAAAQKLKLDRVPVRWLDLDPADAHALALADNKVGEIATWDDTTLGQVLRDLRDADASLLADTGFSDEELARLMGEVAEPQMPSSDEVSIGENWQILIDCRNEADQNALLQELLERGMQCRALIS